MNTKVSIIIATYNSAKTLHTALDSVKNQTFQDWECIIIDGASRDDTVKIVKEYEAEDARFRHISEPDKGIYDAFNKGWKIAIGEWIYYLGSDDQLMPEGLVGLMSHCADADIIYGDMNYQTGFKIKTKPSIGISELLGNMPCHQCMLMRKDLIQLHSGFDMSRYKICADFDLFQRALKGGAKVKYVKDVFVACFNSMGASSGIGLYLKECFSIKKKYRGLLFAYRYLILEGLKRSVKQLLLNFLKK